MITRPSIEIVETVEAIPIGGNRAIIVVSKTNINLNDDKFKHIVLNSLYDIKNKLKDESDELKLFLGDILEESNVNDDIQIGIIHLILFPQNASVDDLKPVLDKVKEFRSIQIEVYPDITDSKIWKIISEHLKSLEKYGEYRIALGTFKTPEKLNNEEIESMKLFTGEIKNSRIALHANNGMLGAFAGKVATTPYYNDPALGVYHFKTPSDYQVWLPSQLDLLVQAGVIVDENEYSTGEWSLEPCLAVSTSVNQETPPSDCLLGYRLAADHHSRETDRIIRGLLKKANTETARSSAEQLCKSYLDGEVKSEGLHKYKFHIHSDPINIHGLLVNMELTLIPNVQSIKINKKITMRPKKD